MPGKTMVGGAAYDVVPGNVMVDGTVYTIKEGKTMVDGTAYSIKFTSDVVVTITGSGDVGYALVKIAGTKYTSATTVEVPSGTEVTCIVGSAIGYGKIYLNGSQLNKVELYTFYPTADVSIELNFNSEVGQGIIKITTT